MGQYKYIEAYTPAAGQITSTALGSKKLKSANIYVPADATVTFKPSGLGSTSAAIAIPGGAIFQVDVTEITAVSVGTVYICHNGELLHPGT